MFSFMVGESFFLFGWRGMYDRESVFLQVKKIKKNTSHLFHNKKSLSLFHWDIKFYIGNKILFAKETLIQKKRTTQKSRIITPVSTQFYSFSRGGQLFGVFGNAQLSP
jgi:hypothetical protein